MTVVVDIHESMVRWASKHAAAATFFADPMSHENTEKAVQTLAQLPQIRPEGTLPRQLTHPVADPVPGWTIVQVKLEAASRMSG